MLANNSCTLLSDRHRHPTSAFFSVLTAPYVPPPLPRRSVVPSIDVDEAKCCASIVDWPRRPITPDRTDNGEATNSISSPFFDNLSNAIYKPHGKWAWTDGLPIEDSNVLAYISSGQMCSATIKYGNLGGCPVTYISKSWATREQNMWHGFHSELALYKSDQFLKPLQGSIVPSIIGVHILPGEISVAMEPPHHSFWIEASADMPDVLKERCIAAFESIHARKILHGDVELRHMLIGGDAKVTIIDFQASRSLDPDDAVMLRSAEPSELRMEMRKVKFKLNYGDAREKEKQKIITYEARTSRNNARRDKHKRSALGDKPGYISDYEEDSGEDKAEPPVHRQDWNDTWAVVADAVPRRFVMPGQASEDLEREVKSFLTIIDRMRFEQPSSFFDHGSSRLFSSPPPSPSTFPIKIDRAATSTEYPLTYGPYLSPAHNNAFQKPPSPLGLSDPLITTPCPVDNYFRERVTAPTELDAGHSPIIDSASSLGSRFPRIKVRDFAHEPYNGPRGYYVPHLPTEARAAMEREWYVARRRARQCLESYRSLPGAMAQVDGNIQMEQVPGNEVVHVSNLKRSRDNIACSEVTTPWPARKKTKHGLTRKPENEEVAGRKRKRDEGDLSDRLLNPKRRSSADSVFRLESGNAGLSPITQVIPRMPFPVERITRRRSERSHGSHSGTKDLRVSTLKKTVMLGLRYRSLTGSVGGVEASTSLHSNGSTNQSGNLMALATLGVGFPSVGTGDSTSYMPIMSSDGPCPAQLHLPPRTKLCHGLPLTTSASSAPARSNEFCSPPLPPRLPSSDINESEVKITLQASSHSAILMGIWRFLFG